MKNDRGGSDEAKAIETIEVENRTDRPIVVLAATAGYATEGGFTQTSPVKVHVREPSSSHCGRDPSAVGACGGTDDTCSCECFTCADPNEGRAATHGGRRGAFVLDLDDDDDDALLYYAICGYANWIETGDFLLSARDAEAQGRRFRALEPAQMRRVLRLRELAEACLRGARVPGTEERR